MSGINPPSYLQQKQLDGDIAVAAVIQQYEELKFANQKIENVFVFPEDHRPDIVHNKYDFDLPMVDLSPVFKLDRLKKEIGESERDSQAMKSIQEEIDACEVEQANVERQIRAACEDYGFLQIVNHGFPMEVVDQVAELSKQIFELPLEIKMKACTQECTLKPYTSSYYPMKRISQITTINGAHIWHEGFSMESPEIVAPGTVNTIINHLWPEPEKSGLRQQLSLCVEEYGKQSSRLCYLLLHLMSNSLGLPYGAVKDLLGYNEEESRIHARLRMNHYPLCVQPQLTWGVHGHTDPTVITLLHQDNVGGLQICFLDGTWHGVRPIPGALVVNVGDYLQAWTNGRFTSALHRVVANEKSSRTSIAYFAYSKLDSILRTRSEFVDEEHPLRFRPFTRREYTNVIMENGVSRNRSQMLDQLFRAEMLKA